MIISRKSVPVVIKNIDHKAKKRSRYAGLREDWSYVAINSVHAASAGLPTLGKR